MFKIIWILRQLHLNEANRSGLPVEVAALVVVVLSEAASFVGMETTSDPGCSDPAWLVAIVTSSVVCSVVAPSEAGFVGTIMASVVPNTAGFVGATTALRKKKPKKQMTYFVKVPSPNHKLYIKTSLFSYYSDSIIVWKYDNSWQIRVYTCMRPDRLTLRYKVDKLSCFSSPVQSLQNLRQEVSTTLR